MLPPPEPSVAERDPEDFEPALVELGEPPLTAGQLTPGWRWVLTIGWSMLVPALMSLGDASHSLGKPTWWLDASGTFAWWTPLPFVALLAAALSGATNWRRWPWTAAIGVVSLALTAAFDAGRTPTVALAEAALAIAALVTSVSCVAGRVRAERPASGEVTA